MRKLAPVIAALALLVPSVVLADPRPPFMPPRPAFIWTDFGCYVELGGVEAYTEDHSRIVNNFGFNVVTTCHFRAADVISPALPLPEPVRVAGFECDTGLGMTTDSLFVMSPSGQGMIRCTIIRFATQR